MAGAPQPPRQHRPGIGAGAARKTDAAADSEIRDDQHAGPDRRGKARFVVVAGAAALVALLGWGVVELLVEAFRSPDVTPSLAGGLRTGQVLGLAAVLIALIGLRYLGVGTARGPVDEPDEDDTVVGS